MRHSISKARRGGMILLVSASNSRATDENSISSKVSKLIKSKISHDEVEEVRLKDYNIHPCQLCGGCVDYSKCPLDESFNKLYKKINQASTIIWIVPHYSPLPSKLMSVFEKMNEIAYSKWFNNSNFKSPYWGKKVSVIAHGAMVESEEVLDYYYKTLVVPVAQTLSGLGFSVIKLGQPHVFGTVFGLEKEADLVINKEFLFPEIKFNISRIENRFEELLQQVCT